MELFTQIPRCSKSCTNKRRTFQFVRSQNFVLTLLQAEPALIAAHCQYIHQDPDVITVRIFTVFSVLTEPAELLLPRTVGVVMVTCRQLKNRNVDRQIWTFLLQLPTPETVNTLACLRFSRDFTSCIER